MAARIKTAIDLIYVIFELHSHILKPLNGIVGIGGHRFYELRIGTTVTTSNSLPGVKFRRVFDFLFSLPDRVDRVKAAAGNRSIAAEERHFFQNYDVLNAMLSSRNCRC